MFQLLLALMFLKDMKDKFRKQFSIHKAVKFYQQDSIKLLDYGMLRLERIYKFWKDMRMKSFHANSTMKEIPLLQGQRITPAKCGETVKLIRKRNDF